MIFLVSKKEVFEGEVEVGVCGGGDVGLQITCEISLSGEDKR